MARAAKRSKSVGASPQILGRMRSSASVRAINFQELVKPIKNIGPGSMFPDRAEKHEIRIDTKFAIFDFCGLMASVLFIDLFNPSSATIVKLQGLHATLDDMAKESEDPKWRTQASKAKRVFGNFLKYHENMYFYEAFEEEMVISLTSFFLDFGDKVGVSMGDLMKLAPSERW